MIIAGWIFGNDNSNSHCDAALDAKQLLRDV